MFTEAKAEYEEKCKGWEYSYQGRILMHWIVRKNGEQVTAEAMSVFYKDFLNKAYERQMEYNRTWWKLNIGLLYPGFKASWRWLTKSRSQPRSSIQKETNFWAKSFESWIKAVLLLKMEYLKVGHATRNLLEDLIDFGCFHIFLDKSTNGLEFLMFGILT